MTEKISQFEFNLDEEEKDDGGSKKKIEPIKTPEEIALSIEKFKKDAERIIKDNRSLFESFCESTTPRLQFAHGVLIDFKTMTIHLDTDFFYQKGFNEQQMLWAAYHELSHFRDLLSDPRRFLENFKHIREKAEEYGKKIREIKGIPKKEFSEEEIKDGKMDPADAKAYKSWHTFYNCLDDIYVNSLVASGVPFYFDQEDGRHADKISSLYQDVLFKGTDYADLPKSRQFPYALLRKAMLPDEELTLDPIVTEALNREIVFAGKKMKVVEMIHLLQNKSRRTVKAGDRYFLIRQKLEPVFEELYQKDLADWQQEQEQQKEENEEDQKEGGENKEKSRQEEGKENQEGQESQDDQKDDGQNGQEGQSAKNDQEKQDQKEKGDDKGGQSNGEKGQEENPEQDAENQDGTGQQSEKPQQTKSSKSQSSKQDLDNEFDPEKKGQGSKPDPTIPDFPIDPTKLNPEDINKIIKDIEDFQKGEQKPDLEKQAKERQERQIQKWCEDNKVTREVLDEYERVKEEIKPYLSYLSRVWDSIIYGFGSNIERSTKNSSEGNVNVERVIKYYADILSGQAREVRPMEKKTLKEQPSNRPEIIRVRFVGDASDSMNSEKQEILKKVYVLIMSSLRDFETKLNRIRAKTKSKLTIQTEGWIFGGTAVKVKKIRRGRDYNSEFVEIIKQFQGLSQHLGWTYDNTVYEKIQEEMTAKDRSSIKSKKVMDIVFEVTDGGSSNSNVTREVVDDLEKSGLIIRAFQIGQTSEGDDKSFNFVWNDNRSESRGFKVGTDLDKLIPAIAGALKKYIGDVRI